ncbi:MAG: hypothetical protein PHO89_02030, partial [Methylacidiphilaceae bacterium]|nr:hypothetical protein [Candidatus Methylacidiphilaceae bacterium]
VRVQHKPRTDLLNDFDLGEWLPSFRRFARSVNGPARLTMQLDEAIFAMTQDASPRAVQRVLVAVGKVGSYLASSPKARDRNGGNQRPPPRLRPDWFHAADDDSAEFRIATALAGMGRPLRAADHFSAEVRVTSAVDEWGVGSAGEINVRETEEPESDTDVTKLDMSAEEERVPIPTPPFRAHLAPLNEKKWYERFFDWSDCNGLAVWRARALERNLIAVAERRLVFAARRKLDSGPFDGSVPADLTSVLAFLWRETDDEKIAGLARGLAWAKPPNSILFQPTTPPPLPLAYAVMKPFFVSIDHVRAIEGVPNDIRLPVPSGLIARLRSSDVGAAMVLACRRARASRLPVAFEPRRQDTAGVDGPRLLTALLIPIRQTDLTCVMRRAYPRLFEDNETRNKA